MLEMKDNFEIKDIYDYQLSLDTPYFFKVDFEFWKKSFECDVDGEGRELFKELKVNAVYDNDELLGFVQFGKTAFGFAENGEISSEISYPVIRNLYFKAGRDDVGKMLLDSAMKHLGAYESMVYSLKKRIVYYGMV
ncbi:MAG: hypothetical protein Q4A12_05770 [Eubacteriales bacterium]|nr:hypothetical protein [Eubacteriales bacterium]